MRRNAALVLFGLLLRAPLPAAAGATAEEIERELSGVLREMEAIRSELDRIEEMARAPKPTAIRMEIAKGGNAPAPAVVRLLLDGRIEEERETGRAEREAFSSGSSPLVVALPLLPGNYAARVELSHPSWKDAASADFTLELAKGETATVRFDLLLPTGERAPVLLRAAGGRR